ncbi:MAG TPA: hypothetical protein VIK73_04565 [Limnochordales bacterium]
MAVAAAPDRSRPAARRVSSSRKSWTPAEKEQARLIIAECQRSGLPLSEAFRRVSQALPQRSPTAVAMLYYNVLRREPTDGQSAQTPAAPPAHRDAGASPSLAIPPDLLEAFEGLPEYIARLHRRLDELEARLSQLPSPSLPALARWAHQVASALERAARSDEALREAEARQQALASANEALSRRLHAMQERLHEIEAAYQEAKDLYEMFTGMASISQIMSLGDFKQRMKTTLDRWGNVLKVEFEPLNAPPHAAAQPPAAPTVNEASG